MKFLFLLLFTTGSFILLAQPSIYWGDEITVADGTVYGNTRPRLSLSADGNPLVLLGGTNQGLLYVVKGDGASFGTPLSILPDGLGTYLSYWTGADMASAGDTIIVAFKALPYDSGKVYVVRSTDGGVSFSDTLRADSHESGMAWMPAIAMAENGKIILTYMAHEGVSANPHFVYSSSTDAGLTFSPEEEIASIVSGEACDCCPAEMVIKGGREALLFRNNEVNVRDIYAVYSDDGGSSFVSSENVDQMNWIVNSCPSTGPDGVFVTDALITSFASRGTGYNRAYVSKSSTTGGVSFTERLALTPPANLNGKQSYPRISGDDNLLVVTWSEAETSNNEVFCAVSIDGTLSQLNDTKQQANLNTSGSQTNPDVVVSGNVVHLVYQDNGSGNVIYRRGTLSGLGVEEVKRVGKMYPNPVLQEGVVTLEGLKNIDIKEVYLVDQLGKNIEIEPWLENECLKFRWKNQQSKGSYHLIVGEDQEYSIQVQ
jgi:hypothetical protein